MYVTSKAGTNVRMPLGQYPVVQEYGLVDQPGRWDHWPSGFILTWPNEGEVEGTIVLDKGDILLPMKSYVQSPITITIKKGFATSIEGGLMPNCSVSTWHLSTTPRHTLSRTSAMDYRSERSGARCRFMTARQPSPWMLARSTATSCSRWGPTTRWEELAPRRATSTSPCVTAAWRSTMFMSFGKAKWLKNCTQHRERLQHEFRVQRAASRRG